VIAPSAHLPDRVTHLWGIKQVTPRSAWLRHLQFLILPLPTVLLASWVIVVWRFNGLYGQDPFAYYDFGVGPLRHSLLEGVPLTAMFWPLGYPVLITLTSFVLGPVTAAAQIVNVLAGAATVCFTYLLGRDLLLQAGASPRLSRRAGTIGALLLGVTGRVVESNVLIMADSVALATATLSAWAIGALVRPQGGGHAPCWVVGTVHNRACLVRDHALGAGVAAVCLVHGRAADGGAPTPCHLVAWSGVGNRARSHRRGCATLRGVYGTTGSESRSDPFRGGSRPSRRRYWVVVDASVSASIYKRRRCAGVCLAKRFVLCRRGLSPAILHSTDLPCLRCRGGYCRHDVPPVAPPVSMAGPSALL
jgi:hypothetical protein